MLIDRSSLSFILHHGRRHPDIGTAVLVAKMIGIASCILLHADRVRKLVFFHHKQSDWLFAGIDRTVCESRMRIAIRILLIGRGCGPFNINRSAVDNEPVFFKIQYRAAALETRIGMAVVGNGNRSFAAYGCLFSCQIDISIFHTEICTLI